MAEENSFTSVGTFIQVCPTKPATFDAAGFSAVGMTYSEVGGVDSISEIRMTRNTSTRTPLKTGVELVVAGTASFDEFTINGAIIRNDAGQEMLEAHLRSGVNLSFRINYPDGGKEYGYALVTGGGRTPGEDASAFAGMSYSLKPSGATVIVEPA